MVKCRSPCAQAPSGLGVHHRNWSKTQHWYRIKVSRILYGMPETSDRRILVALQCICRRKYFVLVFWCSIYVVTAYRLIVWLPGVAARYRVGYYDTVYDQPFCKTLESKVGDKATRLQCGGTDLTNDAAPQKSGCRCYHSTFDINGSHHVTIED